MYLKIYFLIIKLTQALQKLGLLRLSTYTARVADRMNRSK